MLLGWVYTSLNCENTKTETAEAISALAARRRCLHIRKSSTPRLAQEELPQYIRHGSTFFQADEWKE